MTTDTRPRSTPRRTAAPWHKRRAWLLHEARYGWRTPYDLIDAYTLATRGTMRLLRLDLSRMCRLGYFTRAWAYTLRPDATP